MSAPTTPGAASGNSHAAPVEHLTHWIVAIDILRADIGYNLDRRGITARLLDIADDMRDVRDTGGTP